jgi:hypothetical protein
LGIFQFIKCRFLTYGQQACLPAGRDSFWAQDKILNIVGDFSFKKNGTGSFQFRDTAVFDPFAKSYCLL